MGFEPTDKIGELDAGELIRFLGAAWNGRIATVTAEGWPYLTPVWYEFDPGTRAFLIVGRERAEWVDHIRADPRVAFHVADDAHAQHTRVLVQAIAEIVEGPVAPSQSPGLRELTHRLSIRYLGPEGPRYAARTMDRPRVLVRLSPRRWRTWTGQEWHPRYR
jgi:nitroimidazol reductase NimA-like FMN-containing flavoprotein (pyridoxamine 5'-phosphate oxidase superfamily)